MSKIPHTILGCGVMVYRDGKVLLAKRIAEGKPGYGLYAMPGGTVEAGENPVEAAEREVVEETGLEVVTLESVGMWHWTDQWAVHPWLTLYFHATVRGEPRQMEPHKQGPWRWYYPSMLPTNTWHGAREVSATLGLL